MPYQREAVVVLEIWREVERGLAGAVAGSDEAEELAAEAARLRNEYQRLIVEAIRDQRPVPASMPNDGA
jgi:hypothetical protein